MRLGTQGDAVVALQDRLKALGYLSVTSTGYFGSLTEAAVKDFQQTNNLAADGIAGPMTQTRLLSNDAIAKGGGPSTNSTNSSTNDTITVANETTLTSGNVVTIQASSGLNVRTVPNATATVKEVLADGTSVEVSGEMVGDWIELRSGGWVNSNYVVIPQG